VSRLIRLFPLSIVLLAVASGCGPAAPARPVVALVMKSLANEFFKTMQEGAERHQASHSEAYELVASGIKDEQDVTRQIAIVEQMTRLHRPRLYLVRHRRD